MKVILGSSSPRRQIILKELFPALTIITPDSDEKRLQNEFPVPYAVRISIEKADSILPFLENIPEPSLAITCDTIVSINDEILGKPVDYRNAIDMLNTLAGKTHQVISALTLISTMPDKKQIILTDHEITGVTFKTLSMDDIEKYLGLITYLDKAGSYAFQEFGHMVVSRFQGSATNIIGFPLRLFFAMMHRIGREALL